MTGGTMMRMFTAMMVLAACGSVPATPKPDARAIDAAASIDAPPPPPCNRAAPWGTPVAVPGLDTTPWISVWVSADDKTAIVGGIGTQQQDQFIATRSNASSPFSPPARIPASTAGNDYEGVLSADGLTLYFNNDGDTLYSVRATVADQFTVSAPLAIAATSTAGEGDPYMM